MKPWPWKPWRGFEPRGVACYSDLLAARRRSSIREFWGDMDPPLLVPPAFTETRERWLARDRERREQRRADARR